jgi:hypothetical protein
MLERQYANRLVNIRMFVSVEADILEQNEVNVSVIILYNSFNTINKLRYGRM